ncbi:MAG: hypothetical protein HY747_09380 [Elusimicrobia bacterium]|nr:hypothetical protein [Elusimicrobiota bacterium]
MSIIKRVLAQDDQGNLLFKERGQPGRPSKTVRVCTAAEAAGLLRRSRRQIYRAIQTGVLKTYGKFPADWLVDYAQISNLSAFPKKLRKLPERLAILFPEYALKQLNPYRDWRLVLSRLLDFGTRNDVYWAVKRYPPDIIRQFLEEDGQRLLGPKSFRFWSLYFHAKTQQPPLWRIKGRGWGGAAA